MCASRRGQYVHGSIGKNFNGEFSTARVLNGQGAFKAGNRRSGFINRASARLFKAGGEWPGGQPLSVPQVLPSVGYNTRRRASGPPASDIAISGCRFPPVTISLLCVRFDVRLVVFLLFGKATDGSRLHGFETLEVITLGKFDVELVRKALRGGEISFDPQPFLKYLHVDEWERFEDVFQELLAVHGLSSHM